jgi:putative oxidoreductase
MNTLEKLPMLPLEILIFWPKRIAAWFEWAGPLLARIVVGYTFMLTGWGKLTNLDFVIKNFIGWGIPIPHVLAPFVASWECFGGLFLMLGLMTRISGGALAVTMVVAIISAKWSDVGGLDDLLGFEESTYFAVFTWLAICGAGKASLDYVLERRFDKRS